MGDVIFEGEKPFLERRGYLLTELLPPELWEKVILFLKNNVAALAACRATCIVLKQLVDDRHGHPYLNLAGSFFPL